MKIVVLDGYAENPGDLSWAGLEALGEMTVFYRTPTEAVAERIGQAEAVLTNKTPLVRAALERCPRLRYIGVLATGYDIVDLAAAREKGLTVTNVPAYAAAAVGQFAIGLLLEICHHIGHHSQEVARGRWSAGPDWCFWDYPLIELAGKTMGIIGLGRIGQTTGRIARALGMTVLAVDQNQHPSGLALAEYVSLDHLLAQSDVIALHCPLTPETQGLINRAAIDRMKDGVIIINNSRGPLIVERDLAEALNRGKVYAAGLDVVDREPIAPDNPLLTARNCLITPHISWASVESRRRLMAVAAENLRAFQNGQRLNVVS